MAEKENVAAKAVETRRSQTEKDNEAAMARMDNAQPTPTQNENDLAKVGALDTNSPKEEHGGEDERVATERVVLARLGSPAPYETRDMAAGDVQPQSEEHARRGRPRKADSVE